MGRNKALCFIECKCITNRSMILHADSFIALNGTNHSFNLLTRTVHNSQIMVIFTSTSHTPSDQIRGNLSESWWTVRHKIQLVIASLVSTLHSALFICIAREGSTTSVKILKGTFKGFQYPRFSHPAKTYRGARIVCIKKKEAARCI